MLREIKHLQFILWKLRFSERQWCFPILNAVWSCKVTSLYFGHIHLSTGFKVSAFQKSAGLEPSKFRPQVTSLCKEQKSLLLIHKIVGLSGNSCIHFVLFVWCGGYTQLILHFTNKTYHALKANSSPPSTGLGLFTGRQSMLERKR